MESPPVERRPGAGPRLQAAHLAIDQLRGPPPVDPSVLATKRWRDGRGLVVLRDGGEVAIGPARQLYGDLVGRQLRQSTLQLGGRLAILHGSWPLGHDGACVELRSHHHQGHAGDRVTRQDRGGHRGGAPMSRQQRGMHVQGRPGGHLQDLARDEVRSECVELATRKLLQSDFQPHGAEISLGISLFEFAAI